MNRSPLLRLTALDSLGKHTKQMCFLSLCSFFYKGKNNAPPLVFARLKSVCELMETPPHHVVVCSPSQLMQMEGTAKARYYGNVVLVSLTEILLIYIPYNLSQCFRAPSSLDLICHVNSGFTNINTCCFPAITLHLLSLPPHCHIQMCECCLCNVFVFVFLHLNLMKYKSWCHWLLSVDISVNVTSFVADINKTQTDTMISLLNPMWLVLCLGSGACAASLLSVSLSSQSPERLALALEHFLWWWWYSRSSSTQHSTVNHPDALCCTCPECLLFFFVVSQLHPCIFLHFFYQCFTGQYMAEGLGVGLCFLYFFTMWSVWLIYNSSGKRGWDRPTWIEANWPRGRYMRNSFLDSSQYLALANITVTPPTTVWPRDCTATIEAHLNRFSATFFCLCFISLIVQRLPGKTPDTSVCLSLELQYTSVCFHLGITGVHSKKCMKISTQLFGRLHWATYSKTETNYPLHITH